MKNLSYLFILTVLFVAGVAAQSPFNKSLDSANSQIERIDDPQEFRNMLGIQSAEGVFDRANRTCLGNTFILKGDNGSFSTHLTISVDYVFGLGDVDLSNAIVNGMWTLTVYKDGSYFGVIYGDVYGGVITWQTDKSNKITSRVTEVKMRSLGGMDGFEEGFESRSDHFLSAFTHFSDDGKKVTEASLQMTF